MSRYKFHTDLLLCSYLCFSYFQEAIMSLSGLIAQTAVQWAIRQMLTIID